MGLLGLLGHAVAWPVTGPAFLARYSMEKVRDTAIHELTDEDAVRGALLGLQLRLEEGRIDEENYLDEEAALFQRLREVRSWRARFGMPVQGGPLSMAPDEEGEVVVDLELGFDRDG